MTHITRFFDTGFRFHAEDGSRIDEILRTLVIVIFQRHELYAPRALTSFQALIHSSDWSLGAVTTNGDSLLIDIDIRLLWADILATSESKGGI